MRFEECVYECNQLSGDRSDDDFVRFSSGSKAFWKGFENWIVMAGDEGSRSCVNRHACLDAYKRSKLHAD